MIVFLLMCFHNITNQSQLYNKNTLKYLYVQIFLQVGHAFYLSIS